VGIRSFLVYVAPGRRDEVAQALAGDPGCDVYPAANRDIVVVVSDVDDRGAEEAFDERLAALPGVLNVALVSGHVQ
jgi:nitrate reductase NapAB chaperone NapD